MGRFKGCPEATIPESRSGSTDVDLVPNVRAARAQAGKPQTVEMTVMNRGRGGGGNQRHSLVLALVDRDLTRQASQVLSRGLSPASGDVLAHKRQWVTRVPGAGHSERVAVMLNIPARLPDDASLYWCAFVDSERRIAESNEANNLDCAAAGGGGQTVARDDLSKLFGSAIDNRNQAGMQVDPDALKEKLLPAGATPAVLEMVLKVNDSFGLPPVHVNGEDERMTVSDKPLPAQIDGDPVAGIRLRFKHGAEFAPDDCGGGPGAWSDDLDTIEYENRSPIDGGSFVVDLTQVDGDGARVFRTGETYYVKGCLLVEGGGSPRFIDHTDGNTNVVPFTYGTTLTYVVDTDYDFQAMQEVYNRGLPQVDPDALAGLNTASFTDLSIIEFKEIASGPDRGKLLIVVKAQPVGGERPEQATFPVALNRGSEELWSGTGRVRRLLGRLWGDWIVTDYRPGHADYVTAKINLTPHTYDEAGNTHNNSVAKAFNWSEPAGVTPREALPPEEPSAPAGGTYVDNVVRTDEGPDWSRIRVDYHVESDTRCRVRLHAQATVASAPDRRVQCYIGAMKSGPDLSDEFLCRVEATVTGEEPFRASERAWLECRDGRGSNTRSASPPKDWAPRATINDQWGPGERDWADYFIPFAHISYRDGKPASLRVNVSMTEYTRRDGWLNPRLTVEAMSGDRVVTSKTYAVPSVGNPNNVGVGTHTIALREDHGWRWEIEDPYRRYNEARIRIRLHSAIQRPGEHAGENDRYEIGLHGVQPRS